MPRSLRLVGWGLLVLACRPSSSDRPPAGAPSAPARGADASARTQAPDSTPPANVSHGEAPVGGPEAAPAPIGADLPARERTRLHRVRLEMLHVTVNVAPGLRYAAWTFGGRVPGPPLHVAQGDTVDFTLLNRANIPHSMDFHAAEIAPSRYYVNVLPGDSLQYRLWHAFRAPSCTIAAPPPPRCTSQTGCTVRSL